MKTWGDLYVRLMLPGNTTGYQGEIPLTTCVKAPL